MYFVRYATKQEYDSYKEFLSSRAAGNIRGCISSCICPDCYAVFEDSICCCIAASGFLCSKCGKDNGLKFSSILASNAIFVNPQQIKDIQKFGNLLDKKD